MIKLALNKRDIDYKVLFENTLLTAASYAMGDHGAIVEVVREDSERAKEILSEIGFDLDYNIEDDKFEFVNNIDSLTREIPLLGRLQLGYRVLFVVIISFFIFVTLMFLLY